MNNNICQFYIILGNENNITKKEDNVYINATNITDIKELSKIIIDTYKEKAKEGKTVASEIIFLIPNEKYRSKTEQIIKELKVNGKVELIEEPKKEEVKEEKEMPVEKKDEVKEVVVEESKVEEKTNEVKVEEPKKEDSLQEEIKPKTQVYKKETTTYKGTSLGLKKKKQNNIPAIIIFIISLIFFIISLLLLIFV